MLVKNNNVKIKNKNKIINISPLLKYGFSVIQFVELPTYSQVVVDILYIF